MRKYFLILLIFTVVVLGFGEIALAQSEGLVPCGGPGEASCTTCHIFQLIKNIVDFIAFRFTPVVGALMFVVAGFMLIIGGGGSTRYHGLGKTVFTNTVIAVAIIYGAWLITNFTMRSLAGDSNIATNWYSLECSTESSGGPSDNNGPGGNGNLPGGGGNNPGGGSSSDDRTGGANSSSTITHDEAVERLQEANLGHNRGWENCSFTGQTNCTSLDGIQLATLAMAEEFKRNCGCDAVITGGTEAGHSESLAFPHSSGWKLDYRLNPEINSYIENNFERIGTRASDGAPVYRDPNSGATYHRESDHWDVSYAGEVSGVVGD